MLIVCMPGGGGGGEGVDSRKSHIGGLHPAVQTLTLL